MNRHYIFSVMVCIVLVIRNINKCWQRKELLGKCLNVLLCFLNISNSNTSVNIPSQQKEILKRIIRYNSYSPTEDIIWKKQFRLKLKELIEFSTSYLIIKLGNWMLNKASPLTNILTLGFHIKDQFRKAHYIIC